MRRLKAIPPYQPTVAVAIVILYLTLLPHPLGEEDIQMFPQADKLVHFLMFGGLTGTFIFDRKRQDTPLSMPGAIIAALCSSVFGILIEWLQDSMHMGRTGNDPLDMIANTAGAFTAVAVCRMLHWINVTIDRGPR